MKTSIKRKHFDISILPVLTYCPRTGSLNESQKFRLKVSQRAMDHSILSDKRQDRIRNTMLHYETDIFKVEKKPAWLKEIERFTSAEWT